MNIERKSVDRAFQSTQHNDNNDTMQSCETKATQSIKTSRPKPTTERNAGHESTFEKLGWKIQVPCYFCIRITRTRSRRQPGAKWFVS